MEAVLPVEDVEYDPSVEVTGDISQMTAEQYLSWVRHQASELPMYRRAAEVQLPNRQSVTMPRFHDVMECPPNFMPSEDWEIDVLHTFSELRLTLHKLSGDSGSRERKETVPQMKDRLGWLKFCLGSKSPQDMYTETQDEVATGKRKRQLAEKLGLSVPESNGEPPADGEPVDLDTDEGDCEDGANEDDEDAYEFPDENKGLAHYLPGLIPEWTGACGVTPSTTVLLQFDQVLTQKVFTYLVGHLAEELEHGETRASSQEPRLTSALSKWLYGLLARLEKPVCQATAGVIRQLYRECCVLRHNLNMECTTFDADLAGLNVLISISGAYFGQGEAYVGFNQSHADVIRAEDSAVNEEDEEMDDDDDEEDGEEADLEEYFAACEDLAVTEEAEEKQPDKRSRVDGKAMDLEEGEIA